jgi:hypothetical protein
MFSNDRDALRKVYFEAWRKHLQNLPVEPLEAQLIEIMLLHPEHHHILNNPEKFHAENFPHTNPFLQMSLHLGIREQINTDRPAGIKQIYQALSIKHQDTLQVEYLMMEILAEVLWQAQQNNCAPDEKVFLEKLRML